VGAAALTKRRGAARQRRDPERLESVTTEEIDGGVFTVRHLSPQSEAVTPGVDFE
jgi:hypothetical protein